MRPVARTNEIGGFQGELTSSGARMEPEKNQRRQILTPKHAFRSFKSIVEKFSLVAIISLRIRHLNSTKKIGKGVPKIL